MSLAQFADQATRISEAAGAAQAEVARQRGQIWGQTVASLGQLPQQAMQAQAERQKQQLQAQELGLRTQQLGLEVDKANQAKADTSAIDSLLSNPGVFNADGQTLNREALAKLPIPGHLRPHILELADHLDESQTAIQQKQQALAEARNEAEGKAAQKIEATNYDPDAARLTFASLTAMNPAKKDQYAAWTNAIAADPTTLPQITKAMKAGTKAGELEIMGLNPGEVPFDKRSGQVVPGFTPTAKPPTEAELDAAQQALLTKKALGQPLTPAESASMQAYEVRKRTVSDPAMLAANDRQTRAIAAAAAGQARSQAFTEAQAGRSELSNKVEQPYLDAKEKADTLRSVVEAAKNGNMQAAAVQSLLGTLGLVTTEGVKRINTTELEQVSGAGSLLDRVKGLVGKVVAGQPMDKKLQSDLVELSGKLEQSARKKYEAGHKAVTTRYGLKDEALLPDTSGTTASPAAPSPSGPGLSYQDYLKRKGGD